MIPEDLMARIQAADPVQALTISTYPATSRETPMPPYRRFRLLQFVVTLPHKFVDLRYMTDGSQILGIGDPGSISRLNRAEELFLEPADVGAYVRFYLSSAVSRSMVVIESPSDASWLPTAASDPAERAAKEQAEYLIRPVQVREAPDGAFDVALTAIDQRTLFLLRLRVRRDGVVQGLEGRALVEGVPVPYIKV